MHITAILGESVVFNCHVEFPGEHPVPYVLQWEKKVGDAVRYRTIPSALYIRELNTWAPLDARHRHSPRHPIRLSLSLSFSLRFSNFPRSFCRASSAATTIIVILFFVEKLSLSSSASTRKWRRIARGGAVLSPLRRVERGDRRNGDWKWGPVSTHYVSCSISQ